MTFVDTYHLRDILPAGQFFHIARVPVAERRPVAVHTHDFVEMFWVEEGLGVHVINGHRLPLAPGNLVLIRAADCHAFASREKEGFTMVNVAFARDVLGFLRRRYFAGRAFPWTGGELPAEFVVGPAELSRLREWSNELATRPQSRLELECFLTNVLRMISSPRGGTSGDDRPDWLDRALATFSAPEHFAKGPIELARLTDRCPEHLNRVVRRCMQKTTTDLVNEVRLDYAARQLRMTNRSILDLSLDCGITNLGYFYRLFRKRFARTPRQYRLEKRAVVG
jgi:AraC-like DNA-binding protein/quercetin dioxygenase-like cupin family protein